MLAHETAELLLQVGRLVQAEGFDGELSPAQWMALRYFACANQYSRNPSAFAEFNRPPVARQRKPSRHLRQVGSWSDADPRQMDEASISD